MSIFIKVAKDASEKAGIIIGNQASVNMQNATGAAVDGMNLFKTKAAKTSNVTFEKAKGSLFEYIEAAKFNKNSAVNRSTVKAIITDATGYPHAVADIIIDKDGKVVKEIQAKFSQTYNGEQNTSAATSVFGQTGAKNIGWGQYDGMDRLIRKQEDYNADGSLLDEAKRLAKTRAESNGIHADEYEDVYKNLTDETHYDDISSGGTTIEEVVKAYVNPTEYSRQFEHQQVAAEMKITATNMAKANFVTTGVVSGIVNMFEVFRDDKSLADAITDVGADAVKGGVRGGATGVLSTAIRYKGIKAGSSLLSDSTAATVMAGGVIDGGVALYSYAKGEITAEELRDELVDTTAKATTTIFYTKAVAAIMGKAVSPFIPMAIYTTASYVITCTREILRKAKLNTEEYERLAAILQESTRTAMEYHVYFREHVAMCEEEQRIMLEDFVNTFDYNMVTGENYDEALYSIVRFANQAGMSLQNVDFDSFKQSINSNAIFELSKSVIPLL